MIAKLTRIASKRLISAIEDGGSTDMRIRHCGRSTMLNFDIRKADGPGCGTRNTGVGPLKRRRFLTSQHTTVR